MDSSSLEAPTREAPDYHQLLIDLGAGICGDRARFVDRYPNSRATMAIDVLAALPLLLLSATTLVGAIWMSILRAIDLLDGFARDDLVVAVTHLGETPVEVWKEVTRRYHPWKVSDWPFVVKRHKLRKLNKTRFACRR